MRVGTAEAAPGEVARGWLDVTDLPTGTPERLPVVLVRGEAEGPTLWITAAIHGDEASGVATAQEVLRDGLTGRLSGALVCVPTLNPAGLRRTARTSYYHDDDPNRYFPDVERESARPPRVQELIDGRLFETFADADALIDLHTAQAGAMAFTIRDRVLYGGERTGEEARALAAELDALCAAFGLPVVNEYPPGEYTEQDLQRSAAGAALNTAGVPAFTAELGGHSVVEDGRVAAGVAGCYRVMVELDMLDAVPPEVAAADPGFEPPVDYPVRRYVGPNTDVAGIVRHRVGAGDAVEEGDPAADVVTPHGEHRATVEADHDGYVLARQEGVAVYENDPVASMAVRDDGESVVARDSGEG